MPKNKLEINVLQSEPQVPQEEESFQLLCQKIRETRISKKLSLESVSGHIHISVRILEAIEEGKTGNGLSPVFFRGMVRTYCQVLDLDKTEIVEKIDNILKVFITYDPENAQIYNANAESYKDKLHATIMPLREAIGEIPQNLRWLVTCEGAFSYLARDFGMKELYLWPMNADQVGTPKQIRDVIDGVRENGIQVVFCESTVNTAPARQVARETGVTYGGVLYVDSLSEANGEVPTYLDLLNVTSRRVVEGLTSTIK